MADIHSTKALIQEMMEQMQPKFPKTSGEMIRDVLGPQSLFDICQFTHLDRISQLVNDSHRILDICESMSLDRFDQLTGYRDPLLELLQTETASESMLRSAQNYIDKERGMFHDRLNATNRIFDAQAIEQAMDKLTGMNAFLENSDLLEATALQQQLSTSWNDIFDQVAIHNQGDSSNSIELDFGENIHIHSENDVVISEYSELELSHFINWFPSFLNFDKFSELWRKNRKAALRALLLFIYSQTPVIVWWIDHVYRENAREQQPIINTIINAPTINYNFNSKRQAINDRKSQIKCDDPIAHAGNKYLGIVVTKNDPLSVRKNPSSRDLIIGEIPQYCVVNIIFDYSIDDSYKENHKWWFVEYTPPGESELIRGWVFSRYVRRLL